MNETDNRLEKYDIAELADFIQQDITLIHGFILAFTPPDRILSAVKNVDKIASYLQEVEDDNELA